MSPMTYTALILLPSVMAMLIAIVSDNCRFKNEKECVKKQSMSNLNLLLLVVILWFFIYQIVYSVV